MTSKRLAQRQTKSWRQTKYVDFLNILAPILHFHDVSSPSYQRLCISTNLVINIRHIAVISPDNVGIIPIYGNSPRHEIFM